MTKPMIENKIIDQQTKDKRNIGNPENINLKTNPDSLYRGLRTKKDLAIKNQKPARSRKYVAGRRCV